MEQVEPPRKGCIAVASSSSEEALLLLSGFGAGVGGLDLSGIWSWVTSSDECAVMKSRSARRKEYDSTDSSDGAPDDGIDSPIDVKTGSMTSLLPFRTVEVESISPWPPDSSEKYSGLKRRKYPPTVSPHCEIRLVCSVVASSSLSLGVAESTSASSNCVEWLSLSACLLPSDSGA